MVWCDFVNLLTNPSKNPRDNFRRKLSLQILSRHSDLSADIGPIWVIDRDTYFLVSALHVHSHQREKVRLLCPALVAALGMQTPQEQHKYFRSHLSPQFFKRDFWDFLGQ